MAQEETPTPQKTLTLHKAVEYQQYQKVNILLQVTKNVNERDENGNTALVLACQLNDEKIIDLFLNHKGVRFDLAENEGYTALHRLSYNGKLEAIKKIIDKPGVDVNIETETKNTPLILAAKMGHVDVIRFLAAKGANIDHQNAKMFTALSWACNNGHLRAAEALLDLGANVNTKNCRDQTPLINASQWGFTEVCKLLLKKGALLDDKCNFKYTALCYATHRGQVEVSKVLLQEGADPNHVGFEESNGKIRRRTPLSNACYEGNPVLVRLLLEYKADVNYPGPYSLALFSCASGGSKECALLILGAGADSRGRNRAGIRAADIARSRGNDDVAVVLEQHEC